MARRTRFRARRRVPRLRSPLLLVAALALAGCRAPLPPYRVAPELLEGASLGLPKRVGVVVAGFPVGLQIIDYQVEQRDPEWTDRAEEALRAALVSTVDEHPMLERVRTDAPPPDAWRARCHETVLQILKEQWAVPGDWTPEQGPPTLRASLGDGLAAWGREQDVTHVLVGWGESVLPKPLDSVVHELGAGGDCDGFTLGVLQYVLMVVDVTTGEILWMAEKGETIGGQMALTFPDVRRDFVAERYVGMLLQSYPGLPVHPGSVPGADEDPEDEDALGGGL